MNLRLLLSMLLVYRSNFHVIHWKGKGKSFYRVHDKAAEYYEKLLDDADKVAEMLMRLGQNPVNYPEAYELISNYEDTDFVIVESNKSYDVDDLTEYTALMFGDITAAIEAVLETEEIQDKHNVGIKASLESMHDEYDLVARYLNERVRA